MKRFSDAQRRSLHLWCRECAEELNKNQMWYHSPLNPKKVLPWDMIRFKNCVYKEYLRIKLGKTSTEQQMSVEPSEVVLALTSHFQTEYGVLLPEWPCLR